MRCSERLRASRHLLFLARTRFFRATLFRSSYAPSSLHHAATAPRSAVAELGVVRRLYASSPMLHFLDQIGVLLVFVTLGLGSIVFYALALDVIARKFPKAMSVAKSLDRQVEKFIAATLPEPLARLVFALILFVIGVAFVFFLGMAFVLPFTLLVGPENMNSELGLSTLGIRIVHHVSHVGANPFWQGLGIFITVVGFVFPGSIGIFGLTKRLIRWLGAPPSEPTQK